MRNSYAVKTENVTNERSSGREGGRVGALRCHERVCDGLPVGGGAPWPAARCRENSDPIRDVGEAELFRAFVGRV